MCVFYPVADNSSVLPDVVLKGLKDNGGLTTGPTCLNQSTKTRGLLWVHLHAATSGVTRPMTYLPLPQLVIIQLLFVSDLLFRWRGQKLELSFFGLPQQLLGSDLHLCRGLVLHLRQTGGHTFHLHHLGPPFLGRSSDGRGGHVTAGVGVFDD